MLLSKIACNFYGVANIEFIFKINWRLREGEGEAIYEIGVEDNGSLAGLSSCDLTASLQTLQQMALKLGATTTVLREKQLDNNRSIAEVLVRKVGFTQF